MRNVSNRGVFEREKQFFDKISITDPGRGLTVREAYTRYKGGTLEEKTIGFYYDAYDFPGEETPPDFTRMTRLEQLQLLAEKRLEVKNHLATLNNSNNESNNNITTENTGTGGQASDT